MASLHPTILIGYGDYGRQVLTRLLASAALRGLIVWDEPSGGGSPSERRIRDLSLIAVPDTSGPGAASSFADAGGAAVSHEMTRDLDAQIDLIDPQDDLASELRAAVERARAYLLNAERRAADAGRLRLGLDVIVVAHPEQTAVIGALERLLGPVIDRLAADSILLRPAQGSDLLNVVAILDFDNFWDSSAAAGALRQEATDWIDRMNLAPGRGFSRVYLSDGRAPDGERPGDQRVDETVLFLEFLLFEGLRDDPSLRSLYERTDDQAPLTAFGVRLFERSTGLLSRLAAAYFAEEWLTYLASAQANTHGTARAELRRVLDAYHPERLTADLDWETFLRIADQELALLEREVLAVPVDSPNWATEVNQVAAHALRRLRRSLLDRARDRARHITAAKLDRLSAELVLAITAAVHDDRPEPVGVVIQEVDELEAALREPLPLDAAPGPAAAGPLIGGLERVHQQYLELRREQVDARRLKMWWPLLAAAVASCFAPVIIDTIHQLVPADPASPYWLRRLVELLERWNSPALVVPVLFVSAWALCAYVFHRAIEGRLTRAIGYFVHPERGRLADRVRAAVREGPIYQAARLHAGDVFREASFRIRSEVQSETSRIQTVLRRRVDEMQWLRRELGEYLRRYGIDASDRSRPPVARIPRSGLRHWIDFREDLGAILQPNMRTDERFQSTQAELQPFGRWTEQYSDAFLYPVTFLDRLSRIYEQPFDRQLSSADETARQQLVDSVIASLGHRSKFHPGFNWTPARLEALPPIEKYAIVPRNWENLSGLQRAFGDHGWEHVMVGHASDRVFLLQLQSGRSLERA
jgi:hypothetical protein